MMSEAELIEIDNRAVRAEREIQRRLFPLRRFPGLVDEIREVLNPVFVDVDRLIEQVRSSNIGRESDRHDSYD